MRVAQPVPPRWTKALLAVAGSAASFGYFYSAQSSFAFAAAATLLESLLIRVADAARSVAQESQATRLTTTERERESSESKTFLKCI